MMVAACWLALLTPAVAQAPGLDLLVEPSAWQAAIDRGGTKMTTGASPEAPLTVDVAGDGAPEDYPKLTRSWPEPQDWTGCLALKLRLRVTCADPSIKQRDLALVFYDEQTRREDLADRPMTQQVIRHSVPVGRWIEIRDPLKVHRATIRALAVYLYEMPLPAPATWRFEFAEMKLEQLGTGAELLDSQVVDGPAMRAADSPAAGSVSTDDGLTLTVSQAGGIAEVSLDGRAINAADGTLSGLILRDVAAGGPPTMVGGTITRDGQTVRQRSRLEPLGLEFEATYRGAGPYLEIAGTVRDLRQEDRAVTVYFALPVSGEFTWWDSVTESRLAANPEEEYGNFQSGAQFGIGGLRSRYPLAAVTGGGAGLSLAVRMDEPIVHRLVYSPRLHRFFAAFDLGLVPETNHRGRSLASAPFRLLVYRHDPAWGFRSALKRYWSFFPDWFVKRLPGEGGWWCWGDLAKNPAAAEAGLTLHWGPQGREAVKWDREHGVLSFLYIEPEMYQQTMGDWDHGPTRDEILARLDKLAAGEPEALAAFAKLGYAHSYVPPAWIKQHSLAEAIQAVTRSALASMQHEHEGEPVMGIAQYSWMSESKWGGLIPCNLDPDIPEGKGWFAREVFLLPEFNDARRTGTPYDGVALDSFCGYGQYQRADRRRENFRYADTPLSFSAFDSRPVRVAAFASVEWLRELAATLHSRGMFLMTNCSWGETPAWLTFAAPYLDVFGAEAPTVADPDFLRAIAGPKTLTDLPYKPRPEAELAHKLVHGIYPGMGNELPVVARYTPLIRTLSAAGWDPLTAATSTAEVRLERYGAQGTIHLVVHNRAKTPQTAEISLDLKTLGLSRPTVSLLYGETTTQLAGHKLTVSLPAAGVVAVTLSGG